MNKNTKDVYLLHPKLLRSWVSNEDTDAVHVRVDATDRR